MINLLKGVTLIEVPLLGALKAWQIAFLVVGLPGIIIGLLFILTVKDPARKDNSSTKADKLTKLNSRSAFSLSRNMQKLLLVTI